MLHLVINPEDRFRRRRGSIILQMRGTYSLVGGKHPPLETSDYDNIATRSLTDQSDMNKVHAWETVNLYTAGAPR